MTSPLQSRSYPTDPTMPSAAPSGYVTPTAPANPSKFTPPLSSAELASRRTQFYELILKQVVQALTGFFIPIGQGGGGAQSQLTSWAAGIPVIGPLVQAITGLVSAPLSALTTFFGNLGGGTGGGGFLGFNLNSGSFNPISAAVNFIFGTLNPSNLLGGLFSPGLIPALDGSIIQTGVISDNFTGIPGFRDAIVNGLAGTTGVSGATNITTRTSMSQTASAASGALQTAAQMNAVLAAQAAYVQANAGVGGTNISFAAGGAPGAPIG